MTCPYSTTMLDNFFRGTCIEIEKNIIEGLEEKAIKIAEEQATEEFPDSALTIATRVAREAFAEYQKQIGEAFKEPPPYAANSEIGRSYFASFVEDSLPKIILKAQGQFKWCEKPKLSVILKPILNKPKDPPSPTTHIKV